MVREQRAFRRGEGCVCMGITWAKKGVVGGTGGGEGTVHMEEKVTP